MKQKQRDIFPDQLKKYFSFKYGEKIGMQHWRMLWLMKTCTVFIHLTVKQQLRNRAPQPSAVWQPAAKITNVHLSVCTVSEGMSEIIMCNKTRNKTFHQVWFSHAPHNWGKHCVLLVVTQKVLAVYAMDQSYVKPFLLKILLQEYSYRIWQAAGYVLPRPGT